MQLISADRSAVILPSININFSFFLYISKPPKDSIAINFSFFVSDYDSLHSHKLEYLLFNLFIVYNYSAFDCLKLPIVRKFFNYNRVTTQIRSIKDLVIECYRWTTGISLYPSLPHLRSPPNWSSLISLLKFIQLNLNVNLLLGE